MSGSHLRWGSISFSSIISAYTKLQSNIVKQVRQIASSMSRATPGKFLLLQFGMSQITQIGESLSNMISQVNTVIMNAVRNQKGG